MSKAREYLAKAKRCEELARKMRILKDREWQTTLARAYRMLAEAESELEAQKNGLIARKIPSQSHAPARSAVPAL
jgi:hypothetical protein